MSTTPATSATAPIEGYYRLSTLIGSNPDFAIFRRFRTISAWNLLALQAEIVNLQYALGAAYQSERAADIRANYERRRHEHFGTLQDFREGNEQSVQWSLTLDLRRKLKEFDEFKQQFQRACQSPPVRQGNLHSLRTWLEAPEGGNKSLHGCEAAMWDDEADLTSILDSGEKDDVISRWTKNTFIPWFHKKLCFRFRKYDYPLREPPLSNETLTTPVSVYANSKITAIMTGFSTMLASLLPCLSIFLLYYIRTPIVRLSVILALSVLFSIAMTLVAKAKRENCFASTAAFAAVLVVFVGSSDSGNCNCSAAQ